MEHLPNGYTLHIPPACFPLSTDSMVLAHIVRLPRNARVLDLGSGCGTLGLLLCASDDGCHVTGLELDAAAHAAALENIAHNGLSARMESICTDVKSVSERFSPGAFQICVSNPPYFSGGPASRAFPAARQEQTCTPSDLMTAASHALKFGGDFFLVHRPEKLGELIAQGGIRNLEAKKLWLVRHKPGSPVSLILLQLRKGAKPGLDWEEITLHNPDGTPTDIYRAIYHL